MRTLMGCCLWILVTGCAEMPPALDADEVAWEQALAGRVATQEVLPAACDLLGFDCVVERKVIEGNIVQYSTELQVGPGEYDRIGLHRLVQESDGQPALSGPSSFWLHGSGSRFDHFVHRVARPAVHLARMGFDVWGMDVRWALVQEGVSDPSFAFMESWDLATNVDDVRTALDVARTARGLSGQGDGPMPLLGYSRGGGIALAVVDREAQLPASERHVSALIVGDSWLVPPTEAHRQEACATLKALLGSGSPVNASGLQDREIANSALTAPDEPSRFIPLVSNRELFLALTSASFLLELPPAHWHNLAGADHVYDPVRQVLLPGGFAFADADRVLRNRVDHPQVPYTATADSIDVRAFRCGDPSIAPPTWGDHLDEVDLPVLYAAVMGGAGYDGLATLELMAQADATTLVVDPDVGDCPYSPPYPERACAMGHTDTYYSEIATGLYWTPIAEWIEAHD